MIRQKPLTEEQLLALGKLAQDITPEQALWISGYLEGRTAAATPVVAQVANNELPVAQASLTILYGTETGNSKKIAELLSQKAKEANISAKVYSLYDYKHKTLKTEQNLAIIVSTHGQGIPPDMAEDFHTYILGKKAPKLPQVNYAVLALGDKSYKHFCKTGADIDTALQGLGAKALTPIVKCDINYEDDAEQWINTLVKTITPASATATAAPLATPSTNSYSKKNPFLAPLLEKIKITGAGSDKEVYHLELSLENSGITYEPGDSIGIYAKNPSELVDHIISNTGFYPETIVKVNDDKYTIKEALKHHLEITIINFYTLKEYYNKTQNPKLKKLIQDDKKLDEYLYGHDLLDVLEDFPHTWEADELVSILHPLPPRLYSISSSMDSVGEEVHATISVVRYENKNRLRHGACSTHLIDHLEIDDEVAIFIDQNSGFKLPKADSKIIMIGAGTGVAPYRAFLQQRESQDIKEGSWLFFGDRNFHSDFLYQLEWQKLLKSKHLEKMSVAFSRDQEEKVYVQHRLLEHQAEIYKWIEDGAHLYVCGDMKHMANDVNNTLYNIIKEQGKLSEKKAKEYIKNLKKEQRYQLDVY